MLGGWHDPDNKRVFLDVVIRAKDGAEAEKICREKDQLGYFDMATGKTVIVNRDATSGGAKSAGEGEGQKPRLALIPGLPTAEDIERLFEFFTGKKPTPEDSAEISKTLAGAKK